MIIGNGLLARAFVPFFGEDATLIIFASGVSNSSEKNPAQFAREERMLREACASGRKIVYFSTCSVHDPELAASPYVMHKLAMEQLVSRLPAYAIFRLPQVVGHTPNPHTLSNFLYRHISQGLPFHIWRNARRNLIDIDDVQNIARHLLQQGQAQQCLNIACPFSIAMPELLAIFERVIGKKAQCDVIEAGGRYALDTTACQQAALAVGVAFDVHYLDNLIQKYYAQPLT